MKKLFTVFNLAALFALSGCMGANFYDVATEEVDAPDVIPQEGTTLSLDITYEPDASTRFQPATVLQPYRYHVLIDGWEYSYGLGAQAQIPIMANDTHAPVTIIVEGAKALEYKVFPSAWDDWHELYRGTQGALGETEQSKYKGLEGLSLGVKLGNKTYKFEFVDSGASEVFKRLLMGREITLPISISNSIGLSPFDMSDGQKEFLNLVCSSAPKDFRFWNGSLTVGGLYLYSSTMDLVIQDGQKVGFDYGTLLATVCKEDLKALKKLYTPWKAPELFEMTLSLISN
ncbi:MAG: hypothetical protein IKZ51_00410 [Bacteroidales bacterium]|nr:hypothetical protein [Bacteroidales bacterium]